MLVQMLSPDEVRELRTQFEAIDTAGTGMIDMKELTEIIEKNGI